MEPARRSGVRGLQRVHLRPEGGVGPPNRELVGATDAGALEKDLAGLRAEQRRLARAVATARDDIPELVAELRLRNDRIRRLEADLAASRRTPVMVADVLARTETAARAKLADLRTALTADLLAMREVFQTLFPDGLTFRPATSAPRRVWAISGSARLDSLKLSSDPSGSLSNLRLESPLDLVVLQAA
jgi:hypothetical protein